MMRAMTIISKVVLKVVLKEEPLKAEHWAVLKEEPLKMSITRMMGMATTRATTMGTVNRVPINEPLGKELRDKDLQDKDLQDKDLQDKGHPKRSITMMTTTTRRVMTMGTAKKVVMVKKVKASTMMRDMETSTRTTAIMMMDIEG